MLSALVFEVRDAVGNLVPNIPVNFSLSGSGSPGASVNASATRKTNWLGQVQANVVAGPTSEPSWSPPFTPHGDGDRSFDCDAALPQFIASSRFTNAASGTIGMTPCGLVTVRGSGLAAGVQGVLSAVNLFGPLPTTFAGVSITVAQGSNVIQVPIREVASDQSGQRVTFQAPCELTAALLWFRPSRR